MGSGSTLGSVGQGVKANSDYAHIHPMPFYHFNQPESQAWAYIQSETLRVKQVTGLPTVITESPWAWGKTIITQARLIWCAAVHQLLEDV